MKTQVSTIPSGVATPPASKADHLKKWRFKKGTNGYQGGQRAKAFDPGRWMRDLIHKSPLKTRIPDPGLIDMSWGELIALRTLKLAAGGNMVAVKLIWERVDPVPTSTVTINQLVLRQDLDDRLDVLKSVDPDRLLPKGRNGTA